MSVPAVLPLPVPFPGPLSRSSRTIAIWSTVIAAASLMSLALALGDPARRWMWLYLPYTFVGNSLAPLPFDGYVIALGEQHLIWLVVLIGIIGTVIVEAWNMEVLSRLLARKNLQGFCNHGLTRWSLRMYGKAPFWTLVGTCVLPIIPHYPMRVLVVLARYPMWKYQLSVILGRGTRYWWLASIGFSIPIPVEWIAVASLVMLLLGVRGARRMNGTSGNEAEQGQAV